MSYTVNSAPSSYNNSTWVEDWTNNLDTDEYINSLPAGINTINIFCGQITFVNGVPTIDGFTTDTPGAPNGRGAFPNLAALQDFISKCKAKGISVQLSIGGQAGTTFGQSWNNLTPGNVGAFAQALVDFCHQTGASGIDFDDELEDTNIAALAGQLAGKFKELDPSLAATFCVYGGCSNSGPMHAVDEIFLQNAKLPDGSTALDRIYVMTYWDGCTLAQNKQFMVNWLSYLQQNYGFSASQISAGVDPTDPNTSPTNGSLAEWIDFARQEGFSTAIWDNSGVNNYVQNDWGQVIYDLYNQIGTLLSGIQLANTTQKHDVE